MQLKLDALDLLLSEVLAITLVRTVPSQFSQIVRFEFDTVQTVVAAQFLDLLFGFLLRQNHIAVLIASELVEKVFFCVFLSIFFLRSKILWNRKNRHNRVGINAICFDFIDNFLSVFKHFGMV